MNSDYQSNELKAEIAAFIASHSENVSDTDAAIIEFIERDFEAIMSRLDAGIAEQRRDMAALLESLSRRAA